MNIVTHALLPVIVADLVWKVRRGDGGMGLLWIGLAGALPDLLNPHLTLEARMQSWSHGLPFWGAFSACVMIGSMLSRGRFPTRLGVLVCAAYLLHLACDAVSGGVNLLYPYADFVWGRYWVHPVYWVPSDVACLLVCYTMFRLIPLWRKRASIRSV